ncbi:hypothetical protein ACKWTF_015690 [Chironomus riparius]
MFVTLDIVACNDLVPGEEINAIDTTNLKVIRVNDTHSFYNGSMKFLIGFDKLPGRIFYEKYHQGEWLMFGFSGRYGNFCFTYHDRTQPFYYYMDHFPKCPVEDGTEWTFNMVPFTLMGLNMESVNANSFGKWRLIFIYEYRIKGATKHNCRKINFEMFDTEKPKKSFGNNFKLWGY